MKKSDKLKLSYSLMNKIVSLYKSNCQGIALIQPFKDIMLEYLDKTETKLSDEQIYALIQKQISHLHN